MCDVVFGLPQFYRAIKRAGWTTPHSPSPGFFLSFCVFFSGVEQFDKLVPTMSPIAYNTVALNADEGRSINKQLFGIVGAVALSLGFAVGYIASSPASSSAWTAAVPLTSSRATTTVAPSVAISRPRFPAVAAQQLDAADIAVPPAMQTVYSVANEPAVMNPAVSIVGLGAILIGGFMVLRGWFSKPTPQALLQTVDLHSAPARSPKWAMASAVPNPSAGDSKTIRIATRKSPLAMWQAEFIESELKRMYPGITVELQPMSTRGDKILDSPLAKIGGKGLFVKELENALLEGRSDIAVHSTKDVPMELPDGLDLSIICKRHDPCDALCFPKGSTKATIDDLPEGATVGTSSLRRQSQLLLKRPDLKFVELRGNVNTRLAKLDSGDYDAIILAAAGLERMGFTDRVMPGKANIIDPDLMLPACGQGALSIELRSDDPETLALLQPLHHIPDATTVCCERSMNRRLQGGCQVPISGFARLNGNELNMQARVGSISGAGPLIIKEKTIEIDMSKPWAEIKPIAEQLGTEVADMLLDAGAQAYLDEAYASNDAGVAAQMAANTGAE